ncbi:MAG: hypothetical protein WC481_07515 [Candidatus Omnitrophota bacterium]
MREDTAEAIAERKARREAELLVRQTLAAAAREERLRLSAITKAENRRQRAELSKKNKLLAKGRKRMTPEELLESRRGAVEKFKAIMAARRARRPVKPSETIPEGYLPLADVAPLYGYCRQYLQRLCHARKVPCRAWKANYIVRPEDVGEYKLAAEKLRVAGSIKNAALAREARRVKREGLVRGA